MRGLNLKPSRVYQTATLLLESRSITQRPPWYDTIGAIPPSEILTRTQPVQHRDQNVKSKKRKPSKMFQPQTILYEEDRLRQEFYRDHPWELARPRIVLEDDGRDGQRCDWSRLEQPGRQLTGESVVQRQLWLMHNQPGMTSSKAYDIARKEFYNLRRAEEIERRVAREEALSTGAYFGKGVLEVGMELEDQAHEAWKKWAYEQLETMKLQRAGAYTGVGTGEDEGIDTEEVSEDAEPSLL